MKATSLSLISVMIALAMSAVVSAQNEQSVAPGSAQLTSTLVAWLSSQCEGIIEEMEAIAKQNSESGGFSVVNYLRYLNLYDSLTVIASKPIDDLKWVRRKAKAFEKINAAAEQIVASHLEDLNKALTDIELAEPKSKQVKASDKWLNLYKTIRYIATHAPRNSVLIKSASDMLQSSPDNTVDRKRSNRYQLAVGAFN